MKRANGQGSITCIKSRSKPYRVLAPAKLDGYKYKSVLIGYFKTKREAQQALSEYLYLPHSDRPNLTLEQLYNQWSDTAYRNISKSTVDNYRAAWKRLQSLKSQKVKDLKTADFQKIIDQIADSSSRSTLEKVKTVCVMLEDFAVQNDVINKNYAKFVKLPKIEHEEKAFFTMDQLKKIADGAKNGVGVSDLILIMCFTGWRIQEFCNLTKTDYDEAEHTLTGGLKTDAGKNRVVYVPEFLYSIVEKYANLPCTALFSQKRESIGKDGKREIEYIPWTSKRLRNSFAETLDSLDISAGEKKFTPHSTRHTYNTILSSQNILVETRMRLMGQVSEQTNKKVYTHAEKRILMQAVNSLPNPME